MNTQELLWKYAEGVCNLHEIAQVEKLLANDPSLQTDLDSILDAQSALINMEPEAPSMRFTKNVMDALPDIYPSEALEPLVKPIWKKVFWLSVVTLMAGVFLLPRTSQPSSNLISPYFDQITGGINNVVGQVPGLVLQYFVLTLLSVGVLMLMDKLVKKKMGFFILV